jgi:hypothetical protein
MPPGGTIVLPRLDCGIMRSFSRNRLAGARLHYRRICVVDDECLTGRSLTNCAIVKDERQKAITVEIKDQSLPFYAERLGFEVAF